MSDCFIHGPFDGSLFRCPDCKQIDPHEVWVKRPHDDELWLWGGYASYEEAEGDYSTTKQSRPDWTVELRPGQPAKESRMSERLTEPQARAMEAFLYSYGSRGYDDEACDAAVWDVGVRPWPTLANLAAKGLVVRGAWIGPEEGYVYTLTDPGREHMAALVAERKASPGV